ncbi:MAG: cell division topological specificity factor [Lachnospiraceae bacterium]|nr:cell division topological specificity factor [Lachnospiraceae bacterium]
MRLTNKRRPLHNSDVVVNRLKLILASDRSCCQTYIITQITEDIKKTISKYTCIFDNKTDIKVLRDNERQQQNLLVIKIPIGELNVKNN